MGTLIGRTVSHYRIVERIGGGGMGVVYKAEDLSLKRMVALKFLPPDLTRDAEAKARFVTEAQAASSIDHPHIATIHQIDETPDGQMFLCMTHYAGGDLRRRVKEGPLPVAEVVRIGVQVATGLSKAHAKGIVHRDVKPANVMLTEDGQAKIIDFGLAKLAGQSRMTRSGVAAGTIAYMSPEQARGESLDARTDVWSLGVMLYELLTGALPFQGDREQALVYNILHGEAEHPSVLRGEVPLEVERVVEKAMAKDPGKRTQSMAELAAALEEAGRRLAAGDVRRRIVRLPLKRRQKRLLAAVSIPILAVALGGGGAWWALSSARSAPVSIVVLPFENKSGDPAQDYFADGLTDSLMTKLTKIGRLKVVPKPTAERYRGSSRKMSEIAREIPVRFVIEGSVQRIGDSIRVTVSLVDGPRDTILLGEQYTRSLADVFAIQSDITRAVVEKIRVEVTPEEKQALEDAAAVKPEAYDAHMKAAYYARRRTEEGLRAAIEQYGRAIEIDPGYAPSRAGLAACRQLLGSAAFAVLSPSESARAAKADAEEALKRNGVSAEARRVLGLVRRDFDWDFSAAETELRAALETGDRSANPAETRLALSQLLLMRGRGEEALEAARAAQKDDPLDLWVSVNTMLILGTLGRFADAQSELAKVTDFNPGYAAASSAQGAVLLMKKTYAEAALQFEKALPLLQGNALVKGRLGYAYARSGRAAEARRLLTELEADSKSKYVPPAAFAFIHAGLGEPDLAFGRLDQAMAEKSPLLLELGFSPEWEPLRADPRFAVLVRKTGLGR